MPPPAPMPPPIPATAGTAVASSRAMTRAAGASPPLFLRHQLERRRIHAIAQPGRVRPVGKDVTEMRVAFGAQRLGAGHEMAVIGPGGDRLVVRRLEEAWPAGAGIEFGV